MRGIGIGTSIINGRVNPGPFVSAHSIFGFINTERDTIKYKINITSRKNRIKISKVTTLNTAPWYEFKTLEQLHELIATNLDLLLEN